MLGWEIRDRITGLRVFGATARYILEADEVSIGSATDSTILLDHSSVSRRHAVIRRQDQDWVLTDLGSTNGTRDNGVDRTSFSLTPGGQIELGQIRLIVESEKSVALHSFLQRLLGWDESLSWAVDEALWSVREMAHLHTVLLLHGEGSMQCVSERIHQLTLGRERPFTAHVPRESGMAALQRALGGTLFLDGEALPNDIEEVLLTARLADTCVRLVAGTRSIDAASEISHFARSVALTRIPILKERQAEIEQILEGYADDAARAYDLPGTALRPFDIQHVKKGGAATTHERVDELMTRLVVARSLGVTAGAERLGITHGALSRYLRRNGMPT